MTTTRISTIPSCPKLEFTISYQIKTILIHCAHYLLTSLKVPKIYMLEIVCYQSRDGNDGLMSLQDRNHHFITIQNIIFNQFLQFEQLHSQKKLFL